MSALERNVELLLARAYAPVVARPELRARLEHDFVLRATRLAEDRERADQRRAVRRRSLAVAARVAAGLVVLAGAIAVLAPRLARDGAALSLDAILETGAAAYTVGDGWAPAGDEVAFAPGVELVTPAGRACTLRIADAGAVRVLASSRVRGAGEAWSASIELVSGALVAERERSGDAPWRVATPGGTVALAHGVLQARATSVDGRPGARVVLDRGRATLPDGAELVPGAETLLERGAAVAATDATEPDARRTPIGGAGASSETTPAEPAAADAEPEPAAALAGRVRAGDSAIESFEIVLLEHRGVGDYADPRVHAFEDGEGRFAIDAVAPGVYSIFAQADGFAVRRLERRTIAAGATVELDVELERGAAVGGFVRDADTGAAIAGALVVSERDAPVSVLPMGDLPFPGADPMAGVRAHARTGPDGWFEIDALSSGRQVLRATASGYGAAWMEPFELGASARPGELVIELRPGGSVAGAVTRADGSAFSGALVIASVVDFEGRGYCANYAMARSDERGRYRLDDLVPGFYALVLIDPSDPGAAERIVQLRVARGETMAVDFDLAAGASDGASGPAAAEAPNGGIAGRVVGPDGAPRAGLSVTAVLASDAVAMVDSRWHVALSDADGAYELAHLEPGTYGLYVGRGMEFFHSEPELARVEAGARVPRDVRLGGARLAGRVKAAFGGEPVAAAVLVLALDRPDETSVVAKLLTDPEGRWAVPHALPGRYRVEVLPLGEGLGNASSPIVELGAATRRDDVDVRLEPGGSLDVVVADAGGAPVAGAVVSLVHVETAHPLFFADPFTNANGVLAVPALRTGAWSVTIVLPDAPDGVALERVVDVRAGERATARFELVPAGD